MIRGFVRALLLLVLVAIISAVAASAHYLTHGGSIDTLRESAGTVGKSALDLAKKPLEDVKLPAASVPPARNTPADIQVYFAPCEQANPSGIDDGLLNMLHGARRSIACAFYELDLQSVAEALVERRQNGVTVRLVTDSDYKDEPALQYCMRWGVPVVFDERSPFMHNKFCVVDDSIVWTGSTNVTENCMYRNNNNSFIITSPNLAADYGTEFQELFELRRFGGGSKLATPYPQVQVDDAAIECYFAPEDDVADEIMSEIGTSQRSIDFLAFCFTSKEIASAMVERLQHGVQVRGVLDNAQADSVFSQRKFLAQRGARVYEDGGAGTMHHKVIIIDGATVVSGSYNFTKAADTKNDENVLIIHSPAIAAEFEREFEKLFAAFS